jgi:hypothetical protein
MVAVLSKRAQETCTVCPKQLQAQHKIVAEKYIKKRDNGF